MLEILKAKIEKYSDEKVSAMRAEGRRVIGFHDVAPTASPDELWTGNRVEEILLTLLRSRIDEDAAWTLLGATRLRSKRAAAIVARTCIPVNICMEFRRIYPTFWAAAIALDENSEDIEQLCTLARELDKLACDPETDQRARTVSLRSTDG